MHHGLEQVEHLASQGLAHVEVLQADQDGRNVVVRLGADLDVLDRHGADLELGGEGQAHRFSSKIPAKPAKTGRFFPLRREICAMRELFAAGRSPSYACFH